MTKILSQSGSSLADTYDVEGSIAGIDQLQTEELPIVHEMGNTVFSERFSTTIRRASSGDILQSISWNIVLTDLPVGVWRILGVTLLADTGTRVSRAMVALRDPTGLREMPILAWDDANDLITFLRIQENGAGVTNMSQLVPLSQTQQVPSIGTGGGQNQRVSDISFRGTSTAFGAGTVEVIALVLIGFTDVGAGISNRGLPLPGW